MISEMSAEPTQLEITETTQMQQDLYKKDLKKLGLKDETIAQMLAIVDSIFPDNPDVQSIYSMPGEYPMQKNTWRIPTDLTRMRDAERSQALGEAVLQILVIAQRDGARVDLPRDIARDFLPSYEVYPKLRERLKSLNVIQELREKNCVGCQHPETMSVNDGYGELTVAKYGFGLPTADDPDPYALKMKLAGFGSYAIGTASNFSLRQLIEDPQHPKSKEELFKASLAWALVYDPKSNQIVFAHIPDEGVKLRFIKNLLGDRR